MEIIHMVICKGVVGTQALQHVHKLGIDTGKGMGIKIYERLAGGFLFMGKK